MLPALSSAYERLNRMKTDLLADAAQWPEARLRFRPAPAEWSMLHVIDHLVRVESGIMAQFESSLARAQPVTLANRFGTALMYLIMNSPLRVKVPPAASSAIPDGSSSLDILMERWTASRIEMIRVLDRVPPESMGVAAFCHPRTGPMTPIQTLGFLAQHMRHHSYQTNRLRKASRSLIS